LVITRHFRIYLLAYIWVLSLVEVQYLGTMDLSLGNGKSRPAENNNQ